MAERMLPPLDCDPLFEDSNEDAMMEHNCGLKATCVAQTTNKMADRRFHRRIFFSGRHSDDPYSINSWCHVRRTRAVGKRASQKSDHSRPADDRACALDDVRARYAATRCDFEYSYMKYGDVVARRGQYDWAVMDRLLKEVAARGHQAIVRFFLQSMVFARGRSEDFSPQNHERTRSAPAASHRS